MTAGDTPQHMKDYDTNKIKMSGTLFTRDYDRHDPFPLARGEMWRWKKTNGTHILMGCAD